MTRILKVSSLLKLRRFMRNGTPVLLLSFLFFIFISGCAGNDSGDPNLVDIPVNSVFPESLYLEEHDLNLSTAATNLVVSVTGCSSGYSITNFTITSGTVKLYIGDRNCLVKLTSFTTGGNTYQPTGVNAVAFTTWLANNTAKFQRTTLATDVYDLVVISQATQSGVLSTDAVTYAFTKPSSLSTQNLPTVSVGYSLPAPGISSYAAPDFSALRARYLGIDASLNLSMSFTLQCGAAVTGTTPNFSCSGVQMNTLLDFIFIRDTFSGAAITFAQAVTAFSGNTPVAVAASGGGVVEVAR